MASTQQTLEAYGPTPDTPSEPDTDPETYTADNPRDWSDGRRIGTCRRDWVASMIRQFEDAVTLYEVKQTPPDPGPHHFDRNREIDAHREETDDPGMPVDGLEDFARKLGFYDEYRCLVTLDELTDDGKQVIEIYGPLANYELHVDATVVRWEESS